MIDAILEEVGFVADQHSTWWEVTDTLFLAGFFHEAMLAQRHAMPVLADAASGQCLSISPSPGDWLSTFRFRLRQRWNVWQGMSVVLLPHGFGTLLRIRSCSNSIASSTGLESSQAVFNQANQLTISSYPYRLFYKSLRAGWVAYSFNEGNSCG